MGSSVANQNEIRRFVIAMGLSLLLISVCRSAFAQQANQDAKTKQSQNDPAKAPFIPGVVVSRDASFENLTKASFLRAARNGDLERVKAGLASGIDVNVQSDYGATALFFACDRSQEEVVDFLLKNGADPNIKDSFYDSTPVSWSMMKGNQTIILNLLKNGGELADTFLANAVNGGDVEFAGKILNLKVVEEEAVVKARDSAMGLDDEKKRAEMLALFEPLNLPEPKQVELSEEELARVTGKYANDQLNVEVTVVDGDPMISFSGNAPAKLIAIDKTKFRLGTSEFAFAISNEKAESLVCTFGEQEYVLNAVAAKSDLASDLANDLPPKPRTKEAGEAKVADSSDTKKAVSVSENVGPSAADLAISSANWPGFRGNGSRGVADGQNPPLEFQVDGTADTNLLWKTQIPGLGLSCPTIWGDHVYLTTAVSDGDEGDLKVGLYGDVDSVEEDNEYEFRVMCLSKKDGSIIWETIANKAKPAVKRHAKSSHANPTVATDGEHVVAFFGSEGLYCYSKTGELMWNLDFGLLDSGWFYDADYQWGFASSPTIHKGRVIVQVDVQGQSFVAAIDVETGKEVWRTERDEIPTWASPVVHSFDGLDMLITNGTKSARGYDAKDGSLLWALSGNSEIVVPTPIVAHNLIYVASGYAPIRPIYAIKPDAEGDISLNEDTTTSESIPWSVKRGGPYMPSPIIYGEHLYCCSNSGILTCYDAKTGEQIYKERMTGENGGLAFTASPLAADGHLFLTAEDGQVVVVKAGADFELVRINQLNQSILATPAISEGTIFFRTQKSLIAVSESNSTTE
jgi:outer membrane protein assembly factor BamB